MIVFVIIAVAMTAAAVLWIVWPLLRRSGGDAGIARSASNLAVYRDQLTELNGDLRNGTLSTQQYEQAKLEIERRLLDEVRPEQTPAPTVPHGARRAATLLGVAIPVCAALIYWQLGSPESIGLERPVAGAKHELTSQQLEAMVEKLAARLAKNPDDANGWAMLARSYYVTRRFAESTRAYARAVELITDDADLLADYADVLATTQGSSLEGKPLELVNRALKIDPNQWKALALAGTAAFDRKDYKEALAHWEKLKTILPPDSDFARSLASNIDEARTLSGAGGIAK
ncbi:MAG: c-type cytochrome biogenesis protein CcmI [Betaproteobacteria bacterium]|nr:c-type cytochrome biogenesis protein CcmI [Betaproteobacteria bacterium]